MNQQFKTIAAGLTLAATALLAQTGGTAGGGGGRGALNGFQEFGIIGPASGPPVSLPRIQGNGSGPLPVTGSPLSATEERRTVQTLGDGTLVEKSDSNLYYRDSQGRTRVEQTWQGKTTIVILDPVARFMAQLDPAAKTARKTVVSPQATTGGIAIREGGVSMSFGAAGSAAYSLGYAAGAGEAASAGGRGGAGTGAGASTGTGGIIAALTLNDKMAIERAAVASTQGQTTTEDLGSLHQNGVPAQGTRTTLTIPAGKIGNNRDIHVVNERWYSNELQMLVKSVNSDPRFGTTTYQLTNILRINPDSSLFQIPSDYMITEGGGRGRGGIAAPGK